MQKRCDLVSNLQKIVKRYLIYESKLLETLATFRTQDHANSKQLDQMSSQLVNEQLLRQIIVLAEDYPDFKAHKINVNWLI